MDCPTEFIRKEVEEQLKWLKDRYPQLGRPIGKYWRVPRRTSRTIAVFIVNTMELHIYCTRSESGNYLLDLRVIVGEYFNDLYPAKLTVGKSCVQWRMRKELCHALLFHIGKE
jgi:hypothetical protein